MNSTAIARWRDPGDLDESERVAAIGDLLGIAHFRLVTRVTNPGQNSQIQLDANAGLAPSCSSVKHHDRTEGAA